MQCFNLIKGFFEKRLLVRWNSGEYQTRQV